MSPRRPPMLLIAAALAGAALAASAPPASAGAAAPRSCDDLPGRTLHSDGSSRLYSRVTKVRAPRETSFYACRLERGKVKVRRVEREIASDDGGGIGGGRLVGSRYAVLSDTFNGVDYQGFTEHVYDVKTGRRLRTLTLPQPEASSVYTRAGGALYLDGPDPSAVTPATIELVAVDRAGRRVLATLPRFDAGGGEIDHGLAVSGNRVYWTEGGTARMALLDGRMTREP